MDLTDGPEPALRPSIVGRGGTIVAFWEGEAFAFEDPHVRDVQEASSSDGAIRAPMPGKITAAPARVGAKVVRGEPLLTLEAMKMEHALTSPFDGVVIEVLAAPGDQVVEGALLARLDPSK